MSICSVFPSTVALTYLLRQMINADVDGSPVGFLAVDVDALPLVGAAAASPFESGCALFFFFAMAFVYVALRGSSAGTCSDVVVLSIKFVVGAHRSSLAPSSPAGHIPSLTTRIDRLSAPFSLQRLLFGCTSVISKISPTSRWVCLPCLLLCNPPCSYHCGGSLRRAASFGDFTRVTTLPFCLATLTLFCTITPIGRHAAQGLHSTITDVSLRSVLERPHCVCHFRCLHPLFIHHSMLSGCSTAQSLISSSAVQGTN